MTPGVNATRRTPAPSSPATSGRALNFGVQHSASVHLSPERASVSGSVGLSGVTALLVALGGLWALDRYVLPAAGVR